MRRYGAGPVSAGIGALVSALPVLQPYTLPLCLVTLAFITIPVVVVLRLSGSYLPGFGSVTIAVLLLGGIQLIAIGIIGEYVGRIYDEVKGRPLYLVRSRLNMPASADDTPKALPPVIGQHSEFRD